MKGVLMLATVALAAAVAQAAIIPAWRSAKPLSVARPKEDFHYQVIVDTAYPKGAEEWVQGHLDVTLYGDNGEVIQDLRLTQNHERFEHGQPKYFMFKSHTDLSRVYRMVATWHYDDTLTDIGSYCWWLHCNRALYVRSIQLAPMEYYPQDVFLDHRRVLCEVGSDYLEIKHGDTVNLDADDTCVISIQ